MATSLMPRTADGHFVIHEDARTEETEMMDGEQDADEPEEGADEEEDEDEDDDDSDSDILDCSVQADMENLQNEFPRFRDQYRLIKRIGEGTPPNACFRLFLILEC